MPAIDFNLQDSLELLTEPETFPISDEVDIAASSAAEINAILNSEYLFSLARGCADAAAVIRYRGYSGR